VILSPKGQGIINAVLILALIIGNSIFQVMCIPTLWAMIVLSICFVCTMVYPILLERQKCIAMVSFLCGVAFCVYLYCVLFLEMMNFVGVALIPFFGLGILVYIPHFLSIQLLLKNVIRPKRKKSRLYFGLGVALSLLLIPISGQKYKNGISAIRDFERSGYQTLERSYMTEKILGMHFIYHTRFCEFDGWRPPKHDPILVIGMWTNGRIDPLHVSLEERVALYKKFFPENKIKFECSCASAYSESYHSDRLWNE